VEALKSFGGSSLVAGGHLHVARPAAIKAIVRLAKSGVEHVVLSRFDDEPKRFLEFARRHPGPRLGDRMLQECPKHVDFAGYCRPGY